MSTPTPTSAAHITQWLDEHRDLQLRHQQHALERFSDAAPGAAHDIPIAGASWPSEHHIDADCLDTLAATHRVHPRHYRLSATHFPRQTVLRIRALRDRHTLRFAQALCDATREPPHTRYAPRFDTAHLATSHAGNHGLLHHSLSHRDTEHHLVALAAYAASAVLRDPASQRASLPGAVAMDIPLPPGTYTLRSAEGRHALRTLHDGILRAQTDADLHLCATTQGWSVIGLHPRMDRRFLSDLRRLVSDHIEHRNALTHTKAPPLRTEHLVRIAQVLLDTISHCPPGATTRAFSLALAIAHGLTADCDPRIRAFARRTAARPTTEASDFTLALDSLHALPGDPAMVRELHALVHTDYLRRTTTAHPQRPAP